MKDKKRIILILSKTEALQKYEEIHEFLWNKKMGVKETKGVNQIQNKIKQELLKI